MSFKDLAANRYSVRKYKDKPVQQEKIDQILEAARLAPTAKNKQPQRIKIIQTKDDLAKADLCTPCRFGAPLVFLVCYDANEEKVWQRLGGQHSCKIDIAIVVTHMMLQSQDLGLGSVWVGYFDPKKTTETFALGEDLVPCAMLMAGYPADDSKPSPMHSDRKPLCDILI